MQSMKNEELFMASHFSSDSPKKTGGKKRAGAVGHSRGDVEFYAAARKGGSGRGKKIGIAVAIVLFLLVVAVGTCGFMLYRSAMTVKAQAAEVMAQVDPMKEALKSGDAATLDDSVGTVQEKMAAINSEVHTPLWTLASYIPVVGEDIRSVQTLGEAGTALVNDALVPIANAVSGTGLSDLLQDGVVNVDLVRSVSDSVNGALPTIQSSVDAISSLPEPHIPQLREVLGKVQEPLSSASGLVDQLGPMLQLLPQMLGGDGARTYLVIAQNNAELRATGGLPGSWGTLTIDNGVISLNSDFETILHMEGLNASVTEEEVNFVCASIGTDPAQVNFSPDFGRVGTLAREYWAQAGNGNVDGVIALDPVFLQWLLDLTGGFTAPDGTTVDGTNAAKVLLSDTYWKFGNDGKAQDAYFSSVAALAFKQVMGNLGDAGMTDLWDVINKGGETGRLLVWMANEDEEELIRSLGLSGELSKDPATPELGVYFNDDTISKISWYASTNTQISEGVKNVDGTTSYEVVTTLTNTIDQGTAASAPLYVSGSREDKRDASDMILYAVFYAPAGGSISNFSVSDGGIASGSPWGCNVYGLNVMNARVHARAGETVTFTYTVTVSADATEPLTLRTTPLAQESLMQNQG